MQRSRIEKLLEWKEKDPPKQLLIEFGFSSTYWKMKEQHRKRL